MNKEVILAVSMVCALLSVFIAAAGLMQLGEEATVSPHFTIHECEDEHEGCPVKQHRNAGWEGSGTQGISPIDGHQRELLVRSEYILSHDARGNSQDITMGGRIRNYISSPGGYCTVDKVKYTVYLKSCEDCDWGIMEDVDGEPKVRVMDTPLFTSRDGSWWSAQPWTIKIRGHEAEGALRIDFELHCWMGTWVHMAQDYAYLRTGVGEITADDQQEVGGVINVNWHIPYVESLRDPAPESKGWSGFWLLGTNLDRQVDIVKMELPSLQGTYSYTVLPEDYTEGVGGACSRNIIRWRLMNELWAIVWKDTTTIDVKGWGPVVSDLKWDKGTYDVGDPGTLTWKAEPGPKGFPVYNQTVIWGVGGFIMGDTGVNATARTFTTPGVGMAGALHGEVIAYDTACRPSPVKDTYAIVTDPLAPSTPGGPGDGDDEGFSLLAVTIAILIGVGVALMVWFYFPVDMWVAKLVAGLVIGIIVGILVYLAIVEIETAISKIKWLYWGWLR